MASFTFDAGSYGLQNGSIIWSSDTIKIMLLGLITPYTPNKTHAVMTTPALSELSLTGYVAGFANAGRKTLGTKTLTNDTTNHRTVYDAADPSAWTLAAGDSVTAAIVYKHLTNDAASIPIFYIDFADVLTNGGDFTLPFHVDGIGYTQQ